MKKIFINLIILILIYSYTYGANLYLDINSINCTNGLTNYNKNTRTCGSGSETVYIDLKTFSDNLGSGDHGYIRPGNYTYTSTNLDWNSASLIIDGTGTIVENYSLDTEDVWIQNGNNHTSLSNDNGGVYANNPVLVDGINTIFRGNNGRLHTWGCVLISGTGVKVTGLDLQGGWDTQSCIVDGSCPDPGADGWYDVVRFEYSVDATLENSKLHNNYNHGTETSNANKSLVMHESDQNTTVINCKFYDAVTEFSYPKYQSVSGTIHATYKFNWFDGDGGISGPNEYNSKQLIITQNVFTNNTRNLFYKDGMANNNFLIYNNTFYNCSIPLYSWSGSNIDTHQWFNNIIYQTGSGYGIDFNEVEGTITGEYLDYNNYYGTISFRHNYGSYANLGLWSTHVGSGDGTEDSSINTDPNFLADDGSIDGNSPYDFKRSVYSSNGRGGSYSQVMGAFINGEEIIGNYVFSINNSLGIKFNGIHN